LWWPRVEPSRRSGSNELGRGSSPASKLVNGLWDYSTETSDDNNTGSWTARTAGTKSVRFRWAAPSTMCSSYVVTSFFLSEQLPPVAPGRDRGVRISLINPGFVVCWGAGYITNEPASGTQASPVACQGPIHRHLSALYRKAAGRLWTAACGDGTRVFWGRP